MVRGHARFSFCKILSRPSEESIIPEEAKKLWVAPDRRASDEGAWILEFWRSDSDENLRFDFENRWNCSLRKLNLHPEIRNFTFEESMNRY